mgnify:CR=1 FL=1
MKTAIVNINTIVTGDWRDPTAEGDTIVMDEGKIVEEGSVDEIFTNPKNEYTKGLLNAIPKGGKERLKVSDIGEFRAI